MKSNKLWGGRFGNQTNASVELFTSSQLFDRLLAEQDIVGSIAHARMLCKCGVLSENERDMIVSGLHKINKEIESESFVWSDRHEDVHMNIEARLTELIGDTGKKLHTARSRNDQVATDLRLYVRKYIDHIIRNIDRLESVIIDLAEREIHTIMPGLTHLQTAQPISCGHHLMAWLEMLERDVQRFSDCRKRVNVSPLGSAALAGTSFAIDRRMTADELGFEELSNNSLDSVSDRDFIMEFQSVAALTAVHLSRICEDLSLWASQRFDFIQIGDDFCTGSSIMPQKKNPDVVELIRGKSARVVGNLTAIFVLMKGQALGYNRDNQEDKEPLFDTIETIDSCIDMLCQMLPGIIFNREKMRLAAIDGYTTATDLADYLVNKEIPFRDAHSAVGQAVAHAAHQNVELSNLPLKTLQGFCDKIEEDVFDILDIEGSVKSRNHFGGTAPEQVLLQIQNARNQIEARRKNMP
ncbi:MAG: argininosuccinate lyase [Acidiferrobacteraceae bacterium]|nr:argininosuccinate lyase [Acidiferrobacteraceae bacterium]|tara:strand:+ start:4604 stop:6004 length:1401 start_codon:yes stop_codon:yes gene_type:complete